MYHIQPSTRQNHPNSEVISIDQIWQACHLAPQFASAPVPVSWFKGDPLDLASKFYLNKYIDFYLFEEYEQDCM